MPSHAPRKDRRRPHPRPRPRRNFEGVTLDEMAALICVGRRTAERMRDAVEAAFGPLERRDDGRKVRFRLAARGLGNFAAAPTAEELAELENAARALEAAGNTSRAASLRTLRKKIGASLREADRRRLAVDVEAQLRAEAFACRSGRARSPIRPCWRGCARRCWPAS